MKQAKFIFCRMLLGAGLLLCGTAHAAPLGNPIVSVQSAATEGSHVLKASAGLLNGFNATNTGGSAGYVLLIDSATVPADGAVTPKFCYALPAASTTGASWISYPAPFNNGIVIVFSTSGCFTKAISANAFFSAQVQ
jgi:hypothetical protein